MKRISIITLILTALLILAVGIAYAAENVLLDKVDLGGDDDGYAIDFGWGRSATGDTGGNYGGIAPGSCRLVWDVAPDDGPDAYVMLNGKGAANSLDVRHLDGIADDSFDIYVQHANGSWVWAGSYPDAGSTETWVITPFDLSDLDFGRGRDFVVKIDATGAQWSGFPTWGQLCIDWIEVYGNGQP